MNDKDKKQLTAKFVEELDLLVAIRDKYGCGKFSELYEPVYVIGALVESGDSDDLLMLRVGGDIRTFDIESGSIDVHKIDQVVLLTCPVLKEFVVNVAMDDGNVIALRGIKLRGCCCVARDVHNEPRMALTPETEKALIEHFNQHSYELAMGTAETHFSETKVLH